MFKKLKNNKKGYTLIELLQTLSISSLVLIIFFRLMIFNANFTVKEFDLSDHTSNYIFNNTSLYQDIIQSKNVILQEDKITLNDTTYSIVNNVFYKGSNKLYDLEAYDIRYIDNYILINLQIKQDDTVKPLELKIYKKGVDVNAEI